MTKPRICIALPGIHYMSHVPYVLMTLPLIPYLEQDFEVTLVFRKVLEPPQINCRYLTILDRQAVSAKEKQNKSAYYVPDNPIRAWKYQQQLNQFVRNHAHEFDLVIERQWHLVGLLASAFSRSHAPTLVNLEAEFYTKNAPKNWLKQIWYLLFKSLLPYARRRWLQQTNGIIVETKQMTDFLLDHGYTSADKPIYVCQMGVDPTLFFPRNRKACRRELGIDEHERMLVYVGSLNRSIQEPTAIIEALGQDAPEGVVLHIVGDGGKRKELEAIARATNAPIVFHGRKSQSEAALYIGAANLCIAPYNKNLYPEEKFTSASLKVCEYLACGRAVLTVPCERMNDLLDGGTYGFFVENEVNAYRTFFKNFPDIRELTKVEMLLIDDLANDRLRSKGIVLTWSDIAKKFKQAIYSTLSEKVQPTPTRV